MRATITILLLISLTGIKGQTSSVAETVKNYSIAQKRLLVIGVFQSANCLTQNNLDQDSIMAIARQVTQMPFLLLYKESFPEETNPPTTNLINAGRFNEAKQSVNLTSGHTRIQALLEIFLWYLHKAGTSRNDLDSASRFLQLAVTKSNTAANSDWKMACLFQSAELSYQKGDFQQSRLIFNKIANSALQQGRTKIAALAYMHIGDLLLPNDTARENYYYQSYNMFESLGLVEKQIEVLWKIGLCHMGLDLSLAERDMLQIISLSAKIGFKHTFYAQNHLSYILNCNGDYPGAMQYAQGAMRNMKWSGLSIFKSTCDMRMGVAFASMGKMDESLQCFRSAINTGTRENHLFWYKSVPLLTRIIGFEMAKPALALSLIDSLTTLFPPLTVWEKLQLLSCVGICNKLLEKPIHADNYFNRLYALAKSNPQADPYGDMFADYLMIGQFYLDGKIIPAARRFFELAIARERKNIEGLYLKYSTCYKMDSMDANYKSALQNHIKYKMYYDSFANVTQAKRMQQIQVNYASENANQEAALLKKQELIQQKGTKQNKPAEHRIITGALLLAITILGLLMNRSLKQKEHLAVSKQHSDLRRLIDEKEWLLKEIHHRVKNNLRTVLSLLESQANYLNNDALEAVQKSQHRIYAISLIHQKLYQSEDVKLIDMSLFLPEFISYLENSFDTHARIRFQLNLERINLGLSHAIPVALIINETVTNAINHAFPDKRKGIVDILIRRNLDQIVLAITDNGVGIDISLMHEASASLGLKLITGLCDDLHGQMEITAHNGTHILLNFPVDPSHDKI